MRRQILISSLVALAMAAPDVRIEVSDAALPDLPPVPPNFVGLSIEVGSALKMMGAAGESAPFAQALRNLHALTPGDHAGPVLRIGGNSADDSCFVAEGAPPHVVAKGGRLARAA